MRPPPISGRGGAELSKAAAPATLNRMEGEADQSGALVGGRTSRLSVTLRSGERCLDIGIGRRPVRRR